MLADYDKGVLSPPLIRHAIDAASGLGVPVVADPKRRNFFSFSGATVFKPNRGELEAAPDEVARMDDTAWMEAARVRAGAEHLLLTLGADGMALASPSGTLRRIQARPGPTPSTMSRALETRSRPRLRCRDRDTR